MFDKAITQYKKALAINSNFPRAYNNLAIAYYTKGDPKSAIIYYEKAAELGWSVDPKLIETLNSHR